MDERQLNTNHKVLVVGPDADRASAVGTLLDSSGLVWTHESRLNGRKRTFAEERYDVVVVQDTILAGSASPAMTDVRNCFPEQSVMVGLAGPESGISPTLFGNGVDLILYEPLVLADIERMVAFTDAVHFESSQQARDRLRKMTALHELAVASGHRASSSNWFDQLIESGCRILGADALAMWALDPDRNRIKCIGSSGLEEDYVTSAEDRSPEIIPEYHNLLAQLSTHWLTVDDTSGSFRIIAPQAARAIGIRRIAWLPVRDSNRVYGHLSFYFMAERSHENHDLVLADAFASIVAAALNTYWLQSEIRRSNRLYREHVESSPEGVVVCHPDGTIERSNPAMECIAGRDRYDVIGQSIFDWFQFPEDLPWSEWTQLGSDEPADTVELWLVRLNGERRRVSCYARRVRFPDPRTLEESEDRVQLVVEDVTDQARRLVELELFHDLTRLISDRGSLDEAFELVVSRLYDYLNYRFVAIGEVIDGTILRLRAFRTHMEGVSIPATLDSSSGLTGRAVRENRSILAHDVSAEPLYFSIDDSVISELASVIRAEGKPVGVIDIQTDESQPLDLEDLQLIESIAAHLGLLIEQVTIHERLERQALTDPLTGMANRRAFMQALQALMSDPDALPAGLLLVELDNFKSINDRYGHLFGDEMLKQVSERLRTVLRENDVLARYGGDEIAMIFHDLSAARAFEIAERLRDTISSRPFSANGSTTNVTVSIGIALYPFHGTTADELIGEADRAMYAAKLGGRNTVFGDVAGAD